MGGGRLQAGTLILDLGRQLPPRDQAAQASHPEQVASLDSKGFPKLRAICRGVVSLASAVLYHTSPTKLLPWGPCPRLTQDGMVTPEAVLADLHSCRIKA